MNINSKATYKRVKIIENEVYSRVVGYYRPVQNWNNGKKNEFSSRNLINVSQYTNSCCVENKLDKLSNY
jgi:Anaerobic ribonucleoside-triphosphate reductase